jgi:hypothetical protein
VAIRYSVQADGQVECARGLDELCEKLNLRPSMLPRLLSDNRWMARAVPAASTTPAPVEEPADR